MIRRHSMRALFFVVLVVCLSIAGAAMAVDLSQVLTDLQNNPIKDRVLIDGKESAVDLTAGRAISNALLAPNEEDRTTTTEEKSRKFLLAMRTANDPKDITLSTADVALITRTVSKVYPGTLIFGRILQIVAPNDLDAAARK